MDKFNYICTYAYVRGTSALRSASSKLKDRVNKVINDESGMEIIAVIIILAIVLAVAIIFRKQIQELVTNIIAGIKRDSNSLGDAGINEPAAASGGGGNG